MRPLLMFAVGAIASLCILGYAVHMFVGGLVSRQTEIITIAAAVCIGAAAIGWMAWDVLRRR